MATIAIDGADFFDFSHSHVRRGTIHTSGSRFLAAISEAPDGLFRVHLFVRSTDPHYRGEFWGSVGDPSLTDSLEAAETLARARLEAMDG